MPEPTERPNTRLRAAIAAKGVEQIDIARWLDLPQSAVSRRMNGLTAWRLPEIQAIAKNLGVPFADLIDLSPEEPA